MRVIAAGNQIVELIKKAQRVLVLVSPQPSADTVSAALAMGSTVESFGKTCDTVCLGQLPAQTNNLEKISTIKNKLEPVNLTVSFNWAQSMIEKVSYSVEGEKFNLIITPSGKKLDPTQVEYSYRGSQYDLVISLGVTSSSQQPTNLFDKAIFDSTTTINIDNQAGNANYGKVNIIDPDSDSVSGLVAEVFKTAGINFDAKVADYLLFGLRSATSNFDFVKNPITFEQAAFLTKIKNEASGISLPKLEEPQNPDSKENSEDWFSPKVMRSSKVS